MNTPTNIPASTLPPDMDSLAHLVRAAAGRFGSKPCLIGPERSVTFAGFAGEVASLARHLTASGIARGDRVALLDVDSIDFFEILYAIAAIGAIAVPLNYRQRVPELRYQIQNSGARLLLVGSRYEAEARELAPELALGWQKLEDFCRQGRADHPCSPADLLGVDGHSPFVICYTSGTTGRPKGAVLDQRACCIRAYKFIIEFGIRSDDIVHVTTPLFHISALVITMTCLVRGAGVLILPQFKLDTTMAAVRTHRVTFLSLVPTMLAMMAAAPDFGAAYFGDVRLIVYAGAPMNPRLLRDVMSVYKGDMVQSFGQTEDLPQSILSIEDHRQAFRDGAKHLDSIGRPPIGVELRICDAEGREAPDGEIGEIASRGGTGMVGYWQMPEETARTLKDGWLFSGDLGYRDKDGYIYLAGRKKQMIIRGGENVYPAEIERVLLDFPGLKDAVVIGLPDPVWGEIIAAVVVMQEGAVDPAVLIAHCKRHLASYRCPDRVFQRETLPYNAGGKVDRGLLRREYEAAAPG
ncbi:MAG TPA: AMP-binding protein [Hypericibacter adhaerens]|jgi:fatty-acyl-CoA synthase|uniref:Fatty-acid--CoA ligase n=1 Tax=Hypericibacter adhaerens TaxID=2602016 RepID=A0A5J6MX16_9PROT|nr:AMP-binding protein [Hypericibacter adhaerens]QEX21573.1 fatty-acid--CoA ligase [Hypericibacter adhaerens]HWA42573.1 AMP-binding protein [Hypericibacter adhaerens]